MANEKMVAMLLAGGKGTRLESLTKKMAKPAVFFGGKYRIIDFPLSNCANSGINCIGVLTQYESVALNTYIGNGSKWGIDGNKSVTTNLPPRQTEEGATWYKDSNLTRIIIKAAHIPAICKGNPKYICTKSIGYKSTPSAAVRKSHALDHWSLFFALKNVHPTIWYANFLTAKYPTSIRLKMPITFSWDICE